jgi:hypothetical protein
LGELERLQIFVSKHNGMNYSLPIIGVKTNGYDMNGNLRARNENCGTLSI